MLNEITSCKPESPHCTSQFGKTNFLPGTTAIGPGHIHMRPGYSLVIECGLNVYEPDQDLIVFNI